MKLSTVRAFIVTVLLVFAGGALALMVLLMVGCVIVIGDHNKVETQGPYQMPRADIDIGRTKGMERDTPSSNHAPDKK